MITHKFMRQLDCRMLLLILTACASRADLGPAAPSQAFSSPAPLPATPAATPSRTPAPTATLTYRQAIDPYTIAGLRQRGYPGGAVTVLGVIEETKDFASTPASSVITHKSPFARSCTAGAGGSPTAA